MAISPHPAQHVPRACRFGVHHALLFPNPHGFLLHRPRGGGYRQEFLYNDSSNPTARWVVREGPRPLRPLGKGCDWMRTVFVHPERCIGCKQCEVACAVAHSVSKSLFWSVFESPSPKPRIHAEPGLALNSSFPNKCRHCDPAPCLAACPTAAIYRSQDLPKVVLIDQQNCIACGMCAMVCPFDVITFYPSMQAPDRKTVAIKCDACIDRQREGQIPACVEACKVNALEFGEFNEIVKTARTRYSELVSSAVGRLPDEIREVPANVEGWRAWGTVVTAINRDGRSNGRKGA